MDFIVCRVHDTDRDVAFRSRNAFERSVITHKATQSKCTSGPLDLHVPCCGDVAYDPAIGPDAATNTAQTQRETAFDYGPIEAAIIDRPGRGTYKTAQTKR